MFPFLHWPSNVKALSTKCSGQKCIYATCIFICCCTYWGLLIIIALPVFLELEKLIPCTLQGTCSNLQCQVAGRRSQTNSFLQVSSWSFFPQVNGLSTVITWEEHLTPILPFYKIQERWQLPIPVRQQSFPTL